MCGDSAGEAVLPAPRPFTLLWASLGQHGVRAGRSQGLLMWPLSCSKCVSVCVCVFTRLHFFSKTNHVDAWNSPAWCRRSLRDCAPTGGGGSSSGVGRRIQSEGPVSVSAHRGGPGAPWQGGKVVCEPVGPSPGWAPRPLSPPAGGRHKGGRSPRAWRHGVHGWLSQCTRVF